jgi:hypothetical protein
MASLGRPCEKYIKVDISIRDSLKENMNKEDWGHIDPMVPQQG